jgi:cytidine deaminase
MEKLRFLAEIESMDAIEELSVEERNLMEHASAAMSRAYAPYSEFRVGAALLLQSGVIVEGNNQENMAYPSGLCAERVAFYYAGATRSGDPIRMVALTAGSDNFPSDHPVAPCGACRQVMLEYESNQQSPITLLMRGKTGKIYRMRGISSLLPLSFNEQGLKHHH